MRSLLGLFFFAVSVHAADLVLTGATVYPAPEASPIHDAVIVIHNGRIAAIGPRSSTTPSDQGQTIDCTGKYIVAGLWNCHVHVLTPGLLHAKTSSTAELNSQLDEMFNRWGFTHVFDLGSSLDNTLALRARIEKGELRGPQILTVGEPLWTKAPVYVQAYLEQNQIHIPVVKGPDEAAARVTELANRGVNGIKLFTGSVQDGPVDNMPLASVRAACAVAHRRHLPVFAHPQNTAGMEAGIDGGVDVLAHTIPETPEWTPALVTRMRQAHMALIPTLTLFDFEGGKAGFPPKKIQEWLEHMIGELRLFSASGGEVLFGTDIGYTTHFDTTLEYTLMARAGMTFPQILASLTTTPAARFGSSHDTGRIATDMMADLVVLDADPERDVTALAHVDLTLRHGETVYAAAAVGPAVDSVGPKAQPVR